MPGDFEITYTEEAYDAYDDETRGFLSKVLQVMNMPRQHRTEGHVLMLAEATKLGYIRPVRQQQAQGNAANTSAQQQARENPPPSPPNVSTDTNNPPLTPSPPSSASGYRPWGIGNFGPADNKALWSTLVASEDLYKGFVIRMVGVPPYDSEMSGVHIISAAKIFVTMRAGSRNVSSVVLNTSVVGEVVFPYISKEFVKETAVAQADFVEVVSRIVYYPVPSVTAEVIKLAQSKWGINDPDAINTRLKTVTPEISAEFLSVAAEAEYNHDKQYPANMLITTLISILKKGTTTDQFRNKIISGCKDVSLDIVLDQALIESIFHVYQGCISSQNVHALIKHWKSVCPPNALRLSLTINQSEYEGLGCLQSIRDALTRHPNFYWGDLCKVQVYNEEWLAFAVADNIVKKDPYYGFNQDLKAVKSTNYKNLSTVCIILLKQVSGVSTWDRYKGKSANVIDALYVYHLISEYKQHRTVQLSATGLPDDVKKSTTSLIKRFHNSFEESNLATCPTPFDPKLRALGSDVLQSSMPFR